MCCRLIANPDKSPNCSLGPSRPRPLHFSQQPANRRSIRRVVTVVGKKQPPFPIEQKVSSGLKVIIPAVVLHFSSAPQQMKIQFKRRKRENSKPWQPLQTEVTVRGPVGIGQHNEWPPMNSLVVGQPLWLRERDDHDGRSLFFQLLLGCLHLPEVLLTGESGQVAKKNQQQEVTRMLLQTCGPTL